MFVLIVGAGRVGASVAKSALAAGHEQLALVRLALKRLDEGTYGECMHCGKTIGLKRLEALPWTPYCIDCREKIENGEIEDPVVAA